MTYVKIAHPYYVFDKLYSYQAFRMYVLGARGLGKTYGAKLKTIKDALYKDKGFIYLRRHEKETTNTKSAYFDDIDHEFPEWDLRVNGMIAEASPIACRDDKKRKWKFIGRFCTLSQGQSYKGLPMPNVHTIIFDEFIIEKGLIHYLPNEATVFENFYSTVDRYQDRVKVLFLANAVSTNNPYFKDMKVSPRDGEWQTRKLPDGRTYVVIHFADSEDFQKSVLKTAFGQWIAGSAYADYAVSNTFHDDHLAMVGVKGPHEKYQFTLHTPEGIFSVWRAPATGLWYAQEPRPGQELNYALTAELMRDGFVLADYSEIRLQILRAAYKQGRVRFDTPQTRNSLLEIFGRR